LHIDHAGGISEFPDSEFLVQKAELQYAWWPIDPVQRSMYLEGDIAPLRSPEYDVTELLGEHDLFGDGSLVCIPTPGHSKGHQSLKIRLDDGVVILGADIAHLQVGYENDIVASFNWDTERSVESLRRIKHLAETEDAEVYLHHDPTHLDEFPSPPDYLS
jgi:glyoxylase-like metal-dependent hydrolase (beta-lactamase superfamily II)